jgi:hypothetical protein
VDDVVLDLQVFIDKISTVSVVGYDTAHFGCSKKDILRFFCFKENFYRTGWK